MDSNSTAADHYLTVNLRSLLEPGELVYLHGLESSPDGAKGSWLSEHLGGVGVDLDTSVAQEVLGAAHGSERPLDLGGDEMERAFAVPMARARQRLREQPQPQLLVGSSFGGAVLLKLMDEGSWRGPALFLACAGVALTPIRALPAGSRAVLIHSPEDGTVPVEGSRLLARTGGPDVHMLEVTAGPEPHRLPGILSNGVLATAISWLLEPLVVERASWPCLSGAVAGPVAGKEGRID
jgi:hypothetical protein